MSGLQMSKPTGEKEFEAHPEGTFVAVCRDIYVKDEPNPYHGKVSKFTGKVDEKEFTTRVYFEFLTDEPIEINGKLVPRFARYRSNLSWHDDSNLRKFVRSWNPTLGKDDNADLEVLVGKGCYLTIAHNVGSNGNTYANVVSIAAPPKGSSIPMIPAEFVRHDQRNGAPSNNPTAGLGKPGEETPF